MSSSSPSPLSEVLRAADFAAGKHRDQRRKDKEGTPYINHPIGVANILANEGEQNGRWKILLLPTYEAKSCKLTSCS